MVLVFSALVGCIALLAAAAPTDCEAGSHYDGNVRTLANGDSAWTCSRARFAAIRIDNGTVTLTVVTVKSTETHISGLQHFLTGYVCPVVLHRINTECFLAAERAAAASMLNSADFDHDASHTYPGQVGLCFSTTDDVQITGLQPAASAVALAIRNGRYGECTVSEYTRRTFLSTIWLGVTFLLPILAGIGLSFAYLAGILPVGIALGIVGVVCGCKKK